MTTVIELKNVSKTFRGKKAVDGVSFAIEKGTITALLGPNGAGKTTTMSMMLGLLQPSEGALSLLGGAPGDRRTRDRIGAMLQEVAVMDGLKARELIDLFRSYYSRPADRDYLIKLSGLSPSDLNRSGQKMSGGQRRSLGFALAMAGNPDVLFFDEPTVGLDTTARRRFWDEVRQLAKQGKTVLFSTHYLEEADSEADRILLFDQGKIAADGTPDEIKRALVKRSVSFLPETADADWQKRTAGLLGMRLENEAEVTESNGRIIVTAEDTDAVLRILIESGLGIRDIRVDVGRLDAAFEQLTRNHGTNAQIDTREAI
ncbi:ABC transporter ATP-binding protein [Saccharibacillus alkalitolerans]|uniref:ABC transporter ATP-binding protein n=1 Tax=Saccharibacillus alkalitolerans TaxID=2705290 RepID=A0ABX0F5X9_9BACL|nr:ABC transporter ATP-binding protein [Saccharibacillus alkalitolerans]NGZ75394.1 ABC transporter ATP-binding protein [Saccharibacillus alkalitolerans]